MGLWQKYLVNRLTEIQKRASEWSMKDHCGEVRVLSRKHYAELRDFMREDPRQMKFKLIAGLRYIHTMDRLCTSYQASLQLEQVLQNAKSQYYLSEFLAPMFELYGYVALETPIDNAALSLRKPDQTIVSFPQGELGVHQCEKLLAVLMGEEIPTYHSKEIRKRVNDYYESRLHAPNKPKQ